MMTPPNTPHFGAAGNGDTFASPPPTQVEIDVALSIAADYTAQVQRYLQALAQGRPATPPMVAGTTVFQPSELLATLERRERIQAQRNPISRLFHKGWVGIKKLVNKADSLDTISPSMRRNLETLRTLQGQNIRQYITTQGNQKLAELQQRNHDYLQNFFTLTPEQRAAIQQQYGLNDAQTDAFLEELKLQNLNPWMLARDLSRQGHTPADIAHIFHMNNMTPPAA